MSRTTNTLKRPRPSAPPIDHHSADKAGTRRFVRALRYGIGGVAATAALAVGASPALAATTCTYDPAIRAVSLVGQSGPTPTELITSGSTIRFTSGTIGANCQGGGVVATPANTEKITVKGTDPRGFNHFIVPVVSFGGTTELFDTHSEIETFVFPGSGGDLVDVKGTSFDDTVHLNSNFPTEIRWDTLSPNNIDVNLSVLAPSDTRIRVDGGQGNDTITGQRTVLAVTAGGVNALIGTFTKLTLLGGLGADNLTGGLAAGDSLVGGPGNDKLATNDRAGGDTADGGDDFDSAVIDKDIDIPSGIEQLTTVQVSVGRPRLTPQLLDTKAGKTARLKLSWVHPARWSELRSIALRAYDHNKPVGTIWLNPTTSRLSARGDLRLTPNATVSHHGKTVTAKLRLRPAHELAGKKLRLAVEAKDRHGHRQVDRNAGLLSVR